jgi:uncharacterized protein YdeI (YjbR/CyaY-like superfamily)
MTPSSKTLTFATPAEWEAWISAHVDLQEGVWVKLAKKGARVPTLSKAEALDIALCYGWIDGQGKSIDEHYWVQRFVPRRAKSIWSKRNREHIARLIAEGRMKPSGMAEVDRAKADGRWDAAYDPPSTSVIPEDFQKALDKSPKAKAFYATLNKANTYAILWRIQNAKKPETRVRKIGEFVTMLERGEKFH